MAKIKIRLKTTSYSPPFFRYAIDVDGLKYPRWHGAFYLARTDQEAMDQAKRDASLQREGYKMDKEQNR